MFRLFFRTFALFSLWPLLAFQSQAGTKWGLSGGSTIRPTCWPYYCNGVGVQSGPGFNQDFGTNVASAISADFASAAITAGMKLVGEAFYPEFYGTNSTASTGLYWASSSATVIEGFHYSGVTNKVLYFGGKLSGNSTGPRTQDGLEAQLYFFRSTNFTYLTHLATLLYETGAQVITNRSFRVAYTNNGALLSNIVSVSVAPGETFYLFASLRLSVFAQGAQCRTITPFQVFCLNPEGLRSESWRTDLPLSVQPSGSEVLISWPPTRRQCSPEWSDTLTAGFWEPATTVITTNANGSVMNVPLTGSERFFRLQIK